MLPGVLLHVVHPPGPIDAAMNGAAQFAIHDVNNFFPVFMHRQNLRVAEPSQIVWLSS
jgi:hypothetical protein